MRQPLSEGNCELALGGFRRPGDRLQQPRRTSVKSYFALQQFGGWIWIGSFFFFLSISCFCLLVSGFISFLNVTSC